MQLVADESLLNSLSNETNPSSLRCMVQAWHYFKNDQYADFRSCVPKEIGVFIVARDALANDHFQNKFERFS